MTARPEGFETAEFVIDIDSAGEHPESFRKITGRLFRGFWTITLTSDDGRDVTVQGGKGQPFESVIAAAIHALQVGAPKEAA